MVRAVTTAAGRSVVEGRRERAKIARASARVECTGCNADAITAESKATYRRFAVASRDMNGKWSGWPAPLNSTGSIAYNANNVALFVPSPAVVVHYSVVLRPKARAECPSPLLFVALIAL